ncbi:MAG: AraC family transcriptional regulator [Planctomycetota bacterium]
MAELRDTLRSLAPEPGVHPTLWPGLRLIHAKETTRRTAVVYEPCLCVVGAGAKQAWLNDELFRYDAEQYLVLSVSLPLECEIVEASAAEPYLAFALDVDTLVLGELIAELDELQHPTPDPKDAARRGAFATPMDSDIRDAATRFLRAAVDERESRVLGAGLYKELLFRVLQGSQAGPLRAIGRQDGRAARVSKVVRYLHAHFDEPVDMQTLAEVGAMSASTLHADFKAVTSDTPLGYLKKIRLIQARALMLHQGLGAAEAAYRVGYGSASQFSREFKRQFGVSPREAVTQAQA